MTRPQIQQFSAVSWALLAAKQIQCTVTSYLVSQGQCSVMLTGGRSAARLYETWADLPDFRNLPGVSFFFGDERCVPADHPESNYGMAMRTLFRKGIPPGCSVRRMEADSHDLVSAARSYCEILPDRIDVLILGVGEDGHIASLFPGSPALREADLRVVPVTSPFPPAGRLTITPPVIAQAMTVFVLAPGQAKAKILTNALQAGHESEQLPLHLAMHGFWLLDTPLPGDFH